MCGFILQGVNVLDPGEQELPGHVEAGGAARHRVENADCVLLADAGALVQGHVKESVIQNPYY